MSRHIGRKRVPCSRLIELVKERPPLYDYSHPAHCNRDVTSTLWAEIASKLNASEVSCKTKWANLRSNFVRELRRIRVADDGTVWPPQWGFFKSLSFLLPYLKQRGSEGSGIQEAAMLQLDFPNLNLEENNYSHIHSSNEENSSKMVKGVAAENDKDDDKLFMLSLVPKMRQLSTEDNLRFRIEVQQLLLKRLCESNPTDAVQVVMIQETEDDMQYQDLSTEEIEQEGNEISET